jgi:hypothetical protein
LYCLWYRGLAFEVHEGGLRYRNGKSAIDIPWEEMRRMQVWETHIIEDGLHTKTRWKMHFIGAEDNIKLSESFFSFVADPKKLIHLIEKKSKIKFVHQNEGKKKDDGDEPDHAYEKEVNLSAEELIRRAGGTGKKKKRRE